MKLLRLRLILSAWNLISHLSGHLDRYTRALNLYIKAQRDAWRVVWYKEYCRRQIQSSTNSNSNRGAPNDQI